MRAKSSEWSLRSTKNVFSVAQIVNLLCRRLPIGRALAESRRSGQGAVLQDDILRYSRLAVCATNTAEALNNGLQAVADYWIHGSVAWRFSIHRRAVFFARLVCCAHVKTAS